MPDDNKVDVRTISTSELVGWAANHRNSRIESTDWHRECAAELEHRLKDIGTPGTMLTSAERAVRRLSVDELLKAVDAAHSGGEDDWSRRCSQELDRRIPGAKPLAA